MSLLQFILNVDSAQAVGATKNYDLGDITVAGALKHSAVSDFDHQAFVNNGVGFKAFILSYENQGLNIATTTGRENPTGTPEGAKPQGGIFGELWDKITAASGGGEQREQLEALNQINFLNDVRAKVWIPVINKDLNTPKIKQTADGIKIIDQRLYETCVVMDEALLQSLPPPGSLVVVDYQDRKAKQGLTLKHVICTDINFTRIILSEFAGQPMDDAAMTEMFSNLSNTNSVFGFANGDALGTLVPRVATQTPDEIQQLALNYDDDSTLPGKSQHSGYFQQAHPEFMPYMKAFMFKAWNESKIQIQINSVYRTPEHQARLLREWEADKTKPKPGRTSYHLYGMAMDFNPTLKNGTMLKSSTSVSAWAASGVVAAGESVNLRWGGRFSKNYDPIHFDFQNVAGGTSDLSTKVAAQGLTSAPNRVNLA